MSHDAVVIGGSAGSIEALKRLLPHLPKNYALAVIIVIHQHRHGGDRLAEVLARSSAIPARTVLDKDPIEPGVVHVCPANYHLLIDDEKTFALSTDLPVNFARPSIDVTFESAARVYRRRLVGVLLSGASADGASGLGIIHASGGMTACQDPSTAVEPTMPNAARAATHVDTVGAPEVLGSVLSRLTP